MVLVTVGNATQGFRRLLEAVDGLAGQGFFNGEAVLIQRGNDPCFVARHCQQEDWLPMEVFREAVREASVVICHAGAGTLMHVFRAGKVPVAMPRRKKYGEHVDDHQVELVKALVSQGQVVAAYEPEDLPDAVVEARERKRDPTLASSRMVALVTEATDELIHGKVRLGAPRPPAGRVEKESRR